MNHIHIRSTIVIVASALVAIVAGPALASPFDAPFTGTVDIEIVQMNLSGTSNFGTGPINYSATRTSSSPGSLTIDGTRTVTSGNAPINFDFAVPAIGQTLPVSINLQMSNDPFNVFPLPGSAPSFSLGATDPVPPLVQEGNGAFQDEAQVGGNGIQIGAYQLVLNSLLFETPIAGGSEFTYEAAMLIPGSLFPPVAPFNLPVVFGLGGEVTFRVTPEPTSLALFGLAAPLVLRRRRKA